MNSKKVIGQRKWFLGHSGSSLTPYSNSQIENEIKKLNQTIDENIEALNSSGVNVGSYEVDGRTITREEVDKALSDHFDVNPGIGAKYVESVFSGLSTEQKDQLAKMQAKNVELKGKIDAILSGNTNRRDDIAQKLGKELGEATRDYLKFLVDNKIPFIIEMTSEIGVQNYIHTYSGGLGVLAGDKHKVLADMGVPAVTFAMLPEHGYGGQQINFVTGEVIAPQDKWEPAKSPWISELGPVQTIKVGDGFGGEAKAQAYTYGFIGKNGNIAPIIYMSTYHIKQPQHIRNVNEQLYPSGDLKLAGQYMLVNMMLNMQEALGIENAQINLNEGHMAMLPVVMMRKYLESKGLDLSDESKINDIVANNKQLFLEALSYVRSKTHFVTHTIDASAFDKYSEGDARKVLDPRDLNVIFAMLNKDLPKSNFHLNQEKLSEIADETQIEQLVTEGALIRIGEKLYVNPDKNEHEVLGKVSKVLQNGDFTKMSELIRETQVPFKGFGPLYGNHDNWGVLMAPTAFFFAGSANAVAKIHEQVTNDHVFTDPAEKARMNNVTNAIHSNTWWSEAVNVRDKLAPTIGEASDNYLNGFGMLALKDNVEMQQAIEAAHKKEKLEASGYVNKLIEEQFGIENAVTVDNVDNTMMAVFARRSKGYKLNDLFVHDIVKGGYKEIAANMKDGDQVVIVAAGKAHPKDAEGMGYVHNIISNQKRIYEETGGKVIVVYKENYDMEDGMMFSKFDLSIANPVVGWEASGTSPMKNPLRLIMHTYDGFFAEFEQVAKNIYGIDDASFGFGPRVVEKDYKKPGLKDEYAGAFKNKFAQITDTFFNNRETWVRKQVEQLAIFTSGFQMERFAESYLSVWDNKSEGFHQVANLDGKQ